LPPFNTLRAQIIERGTKPRILDDPSLIRVEYNVVENTDETLKADPYFATWIEMSPKYGFPPAVNEDGRIQGLTGATLDGEMHAKTGEGWWEVVGVPAFPDISRLSTGAEKIMDDPLFSDDPRKRRNPYLTGNVKVFDQLTNELLAETNTTVPVAFGGCCGCHLQLTEDRDMDPTPENSFKLMGELHERDSTINIAEIDPDGDGKMGPVRCSVCHWDPAMGESTAPGGYVDSDDNPLPTSQYSFSRVLHGWHVQNDTVLQYDPEFATNCYNCHPGNGLTCYRGHHTLKPSSTGVGDLWCTDCHGDLNQRLAEGQLDNPWSEETLPTCKQCHSVETGEGSASGDLHIGIFGEFLNSRSHKNETLLCSSCHGAPHALYPSTLAKDNEQSIELQGFAGPIGSFNSCTVCHTNSVKNNGVNIHTLTGGTTP